MPVRIVMQRTNEYIERSLLMDSFIASVFGSILGIFFWLCHDSVQHNIEMKQRVDKYIQRLKEIDKERKRISNG
jgi:hypothetical protein